MGIKEKLAHELLRYIKSHESEEPPEFKPMDKAIENSGENDESPPDKNKEKRADQLGTVRDKASGCVRCSLSENRKRVVFGEGTIEARVLVIGEAPGAEEDKKGLPFVGRAGELLRGGFKKVGLQEDDIYITNTVKCRPPQNRNPKSNELQSCQDYLDTQLDLIEPEVVLSLGNFALRYCLEDDRNITSSRGQKYDWNNRILIPTYHPAYILRNRSEAETFIGDLKLVVSALS